MLELWQQTYLDEADRDRGNIVGAGYAATR